MLAGGGLDCFREPDHMATQPDLGGNLSGAVPDVKSPPCTQASSRWRTTWC